VTYTTDFPLYFQRRLPAVDLPPSPAATSSRGMKRGVVRVVAHEERIAGGAGRAGAGCYKNAVGEGVGRALERGVGAGAWGARARRGVEGADLVLAFPETSHGILN
jgi:hypothetical protein